MDEKGEEQGKGGKLREDEGRKGKEWIRKEKSKVEVVEGRR